MPRSLALLVVTVAVVASACTSSAAALTPSPGGFISVYAAWARPADAAAESAAYLTITNGQLKDDVLAGASTPVAASATVHQTSTDDSGMTGMERTESVTIRAGQTVVFEPGGYHVMLAGLKQALTAGSTFPLTLTFEQTGPVTVAVEVRTS